jgi:hypothetical protein
VGSSPSWWASARAVRPSSSRARVRRPPKPSGSGRGRSRGSGGSSARSERRARRSPFPKCRRWRGGSQASGRSPSAGCPPRPGAPGGGARRLGEGLCGAGAALPAGLLRFLGYDPTLSILSSRSPKSSNSGYWIWAEGGSISERWAGQLPSGASTPRFIHGLHRRKRKARDELGLVAGWSGAEFGEEQLREGSGVALGRGSYPRLLFVSRLAPDDKPSRPGSRRRRRVPQKSTHGLPGSVQAKPSTY